MDLRHLGPRQRRVIERLQAGAEILVTLTDFQGTRGVAYSLQDGTELARETVDGMRVRKLLVPGHPGLGLTGVPQTWRLRPDFAWPEAPTPKPKRERKRRAA